MSGPTQRVRQGSFGKRVRCPIRELIADGLTEAGHVAEVPLPAIGFRG